MFSRLFAAVFLVLGCFIAGCLMPARTIIHQENAASLSGGKIVQLTLVNGEVINFDTAGGRFYGNYEDRQRVIVGRSAAGRRLAIGLEHVHLALVESHAGEQGYVDVFPALIVVAMVFALLLQGSRR